MLVQAFLDVVSLHRWFLFLPPPSPSSLSCSSFYFPLLHRPSMLYVLLLSQASKLPPFHVKYHMREKRFQDKVAEGEGGGEQE